uniref:Uncharacterized protein n=1 Tax=Arundo donax TaxID=35708 RepID=A0A0A8ZZW3_ARUDO
MMIACSTKCLNKQCLVDSDGSWLSLPTTSFFLLLFNANCKLKF